MKVRLGKYQDRCAKPNDSVEIQPRRAPACFPVEAFFAGAFLPAAGLAPAFFAALFLAVFFILVLAVAFFVLFVVFVAMILPCAHVEI